MNLERALRLPVLENNLIKVVIGGLLSLIPIVNLFTFGYFYRLMQNILAGDYRLPEWDDWGEKFVTGLQVFLIGLLYFLIPLLIMAVSGGAGVMMHRPGGSAGGMLLSMLVLLLELVILPMALSHFVASGRWGAAFELGVIFNRIAATGSVYWVAILVTLALTLVLGLLMTIPILGWIVGVFGGFYVGCVCWILFAEAYLAGVGEKQT